MTDQRAYSILRQMYEEYMVAGGPFRKEAFGWFAYKDRVEAIRVAIRCLTGVELDSVIDVQAEPQTLKDAKSALPPASSASSAVKSDA